MPRDLPWDLRAQQGGKMHPRSLLARDLLGCSLKPLLCRLKRWSLLYTMTRVTRHLSVLRPFASHVIPPFACQQWRYLSVSAPSRCARSTPRLPLPLVYDQLVRSGTFADDVAQRRCVGQLEGMKSAVLHHLEGRGQDGLTGLYLHGPVGSGKTMLMNMLYSSLVEDLKGSRHSSAVVRHHFHDFLLSIHAKIHQLRQQEGGFPDPCGRISSELTAGVKVLFFDELQIMGIADAMIVLHLFRHLWARGLVVVATSNVPPEELYQGGLNRDLFLPFIHLLKEHSDIIHVKSVCDYRRFTRSDAKTSPRPPATFLHPLNTRTDDQLMQLKRSIGASGPPKATEVPVRMGRRLAVRKSWEDGADSGRGIAEFDFDELCRRNLGAPDYLSIADHFHTVILTNVPAFSHDDHDAARRLVTLLDILYDKPSRLICTAAAPAERIFDGLIRKCLEAMSDGDGESGHHHMPGAAAREGEWLSERRKYDDGGGKGQDGSAIEETIRRLTSGARGGDDQPSSSSSRDADVGAVRVADHGGSSGRHASVFNLLGHIKEEVEWSATGLRTSALADLAPQRQDVLWTYQRAISRLMENSLTRQQPAAA
ncbi:unnamed protein product [Vitrella brassicaformis CCMP3155]|uniref:AAA+ ATPase domain-containing protein n=1 Tax=Vitrella brassicaformis (strain CCMP3155) TaxID=1169540 RepID=A0A0G4ELV8_VITBC|nr:unnamed protein product [Vitrella brassicaformis CCMP3155]|eukprot:CEL98004.1 unnamed protein product [Vitrella brassicaformis CCMP3155]